MPEMSPPQRDLKRQPSPLTVGLLLFVVTVAGFGLRFHRLGAYSFFGDEIFTVRDAGQLSQLPFAKVVGYVPTALALRASGIDFDRFDPSESATWKSAGVTELRARFASCLVGALSIPILTLAMIPLLGARAALITGAFLAIGPWHLLWSQAARYYSQQFLFYTLALIGYYVATDRNRRLLFGLAMLAMLLAGLSQPTAMVIVTVFAGDHILCLIRGRRLRLGWTGWLSGVAACAVVVAAMATDVGRNANEWAQFAGRVYHTPLTLLQGVVYMVHPPVVTAAVLGAVLLARRRERLTAFLLLTAIAPVVVFSLLAPTQLVRLKYVFVTLFGWLALAGLCCDVLYEHLATKAGRVAASVPFLVVLAGLVLRTYEYDRGANRHRPPWRQAYQYVRSHRKPGQAVMADRGLGSFYLEEPVLRKLPKNAAELCGAKEPTWIVLEAVPAVGPNNALWLDTVAQLRWYGDSKAIAPFVSTRVYYFDPHSSGACSALQPPERTEPTPGRIQ